MQRGHASGLAWDVLPADWAQEPVYYDPERWSDGPLYRDTTVHTAFDAVGNELDALLAKHGYIRDGRLYRAERPNHDNLVLFCHFGVECVLLAHLFSISPVPLWHYAVALTSSVTAVSYTHLDVYKRQLSPRGDWRMPSDACAAVWQQELDTLCASEQPS